MSDKIIIPEAFSVASGVIDIYRGTVSGQRLRRGLARLLKDAPATMAFFDGLILSDDK